MIGFIFALFSCFIPIKACADHVIPTMALDEIETLEGSSLDTQRIFLIRHGESELNQCNVNGIPLTSGKSFSARLTTSGRQQASALAKKLAAKLDPNQKIYLLASASLRAQETADLLFEELSSLFFDVHLGHSYEGLCELGMGEWEGKAKDQAFYDATRHWENLSQAQKFHTSKVEGGESFNQVAQRALRTLHEICQEYAPHTLFIVCHFHTMNALVLELSGHVPLLSHEASSPLPFLIFKNCDLLELNIPQGEKMGIKRHIRSRADH